MTDRDKAGLRVRGRLLRLADGLDTARAADVDIYFAARASVTGRRWCHSGGLLDVARFARRVASGIGKCRGWLDTSGTAIDNARCRRAIKDATAVLVAVDNLRAKRGR